MRLKSERIACIGEIKVERDSVTCAECSARSSQNDGDSVLSPRQGKVERVDEIIGKMMKYYSSTVSHQLLHAVYLVTYM